MKKEKVRTKFILLSLGLSAVIRCEAMGAEPTANHSTLEGEWIESNSNGPQGVFQVKKNKGVFFKFNEDESDVDDDETWLISPGGPGVFRMIREDEKQRLMVLHSHNRATSFVADKWSNYSYDQKESTPEVVVGRWKVMGMEKDALEMEFSSVSTVTTWSNKGSANWAAHYIGREDGKLCFIVVPVESSKSYRVELIPLPGEEGFMVTGFKGKKNTALIYKNKPPYGLGKIPGEEK